MTARRVVLIAVLAGVQFLVVLDSLAVALALPQIGRDLDLPPAGLAWLVNGYSLALVAGLLLAGRVSDVHGRRRTLLAGLVLLTAGSIVAGLASGPELLMTGRVVQGAGAALAYPPALALTGEHFPADPWRSRAFAAGAVAGASGTIAGAGFGGTVTAALGWAWVFLLTVPLGVALLLAAAVLLPPVTAPAAGRRLDLPGAALAALVCVALVVLLGRLEHPRLADPALLSAPVAALALLALVRWERGCPDPLFPASLVRSRRLLGGCLGIAANSALYSAVVFVGALHLQQEMRLSPAQAGLAFLPVSAASLLAGAALVTPLRRRWGSVPVAVAGLALGSAALALLARAPADASYLHLLPALVLIGLALTAGFVSLTEHTVGSGAPGTRGVTSGLFETATHLGGALSVSTYAVVLSATGSAGPAYAAGSVLVGAGAVVVLALLQPRRAPAAA